MSEPMAHPENTTPANPAQGVSEEMVEAAIEAWNDIYEAEIQIGALNYTDNKREAMRAALTAAIGAGGQAVADLTYGQKLIAEAIVNHFGERDERYDEYDGDTTVQDVWEAFDALSQPHPADERVVEAERRRGVGQGMAIAAGIVMSGWGNTVYVKEILGAAGYTSAEAMKADGVDDYDIDLCRPALDELSAQEGRNG